ncbi:MAG TPA: hypothetical protein VJ978_01670 [Nitriliruptoraceae bacterium]|nr:hypothetical protein [Nitriliruptoraceae bacterium]
MKRIATIAALTALAVGGSVTAAAAGPPANAECWGTVSAQAARVDGRASGEHASQQASPRAGLGNLSRDLGFDHISDLGSFLGDVDGIDETNCG